MRMCLCLCLYVCAFVKAEQTNNPFCLSVVSKQNETNKRSKTETKPQQKRLIKYEFKEAPKIAALVLPEHYLNKNNKIKYLFKDAIGDCLHLFSQSLISTKNDTSSSKMHWILLAPVLPQFNLNKNNSSSTCSKVHWIFLAPVLPEFNLNKNNNSSTCSKVPRRLLAHVLPEFNLNKK